MAKLIYSAIASLDGYVADDEGNFDWAAPDEEVHAFVNDLESSTCSSCPPWWEAATDGFPTTSA